MANFHKYNVNSESITEDNDTSSSDSNKLIPETKKINATVYKDNENGEIINPGTKYYKTKPGYIFIIKIDIIEYKLKKIFFLKNKNASSPPINNYQLASHDEEKKSLLKGEQKNTEVLLYFETNTKNSDIKKLLVFMPCEIDNSQQEIVQETETIYNTLINDNISILFNILGGDTKINLINDKEQIDGTLKKITTGLDYNFKVLIVSPKKLPVFNIDTTINITSTNEFPLNTQSSSKDRVIIRPPEASETKSCKASMVYKNTLDGTIRYISKKGDNDTQYGGNDKEEEMSNFLKVLGLLVGVMIFIIGIIFFNSRSKSSSSSKKTVNKSNTLPSSMNDNKI